MFGGDLRRWAVIGAAVVVAACSGKLLTITVEDSSETVIERGTPLEVLVRDMGFGDFTDLDISSRAAITNQGVEPGDISDVYFERLTLSVTDPAGADLAFIDSLEFYVSADGLPTILVASRYNFPAGQGSVEMVLEDVDIVDYVVADSMDITTEVTGSRPNADTTVLGEFALKVGATVQGACNQTKKNKE
jgi:hypothetical protein